MDLRSDHTRGNKMNIEPKNKTKKTADHPEQSGGEEGDCPISCEAEGRTSEERQKMPPPSGAPRRTSRAGSERGDSERNRPGPASSKRQRSPKTRSRSRSGEPSSLSTDDERPSDVYDTTNDGEEEEDGSECGSESADHPFRKRGRPKTTGQFAEIASARERYNAAKREELDMRIQESVVKSLGAAADVIGGRTLGEVPLAVLSSTIADSLEVIEKTTTISKGLKGTYVKALRTVSAQIKSVTDELSLRAQARHTEDANMAAVEMMRTRLKKAEEEKADLARQLEEERRRPPPPSPRQEHPPSPKPQRPKRATRRKRASDLPMDFSEGEAQEMGWDDELGAAETGGTETDGEVMMSLFPPIPPTTSREQDPPPITPWEREASEMEAMEGRLLQKLAAMIDEKLGGRTMGPSGLHSRSVGFLNTSMETVVPRREPLPPFRPLLPPREEGNRTKKGGKKKRQKPVQGAEQSALKPAESRREGTDPLPAREQPPAPENTWARVVRKGKSKSGAASSLRNPPPQAATRDCQKTPKAAGKGGEGTAGRAPPPPKKSVAKGGTTGRASPPNAKNRKLPRSAAVVIGCPPGMYEAVLRETRSKIDLDSLDIGGLRVRRTQTGALSHEIEGEDREPKADALAESIRKLFRDRPEIKVTRPKMKADIRVIGLDDVTSAEDVASAIAKEGQCDLAEVNAGRINRSPNGLGTLRARCPLKAARKIASKGHIRVGWVLARAVLLEERPLQCYRCHEGGHVQARCPSSTDRSDRCYKCSEKGHNARDCAAVQFKCAPCADRGLPSAHRVGGKACRARNKGRKGKPFTASTEGTGEGEQSAPLPTMARTPPDNTAGHDSGPADMDAVSQSSKRGGSPNVSSRAKRRKDKNERGGETSSDDSGRVGGAGDAKKGRKTRGER